MRSRWKLSIRSLQRESAEPIAISHVFQTPQDDVVKLKYFVLSSPTKIEGLKVEVLTGLAGTLSLFPLRSFWPKRYWGWRHWMKGENGFEPRLDGCPSALQWRGNNQRVHKLWLINMWVKCISSRAKSDVVFGLIGHNKTGGRQVCFLSVASHTGNSHSSVVFFLTTRVWQFGCACCSTLVKNEKESHDLKALSLIQRSDLAVTGQAPKQSTSHSLLSRVHNLCTLPAA